MKKTILTLVLGLSSVLMMAQKEARPFRCYLYNSEYEVYLDIDLYEESINVPESGAKTLVAAYSPRSVPRRFRCAVVDSPRK